jgi:pheromone shutdown-related protein TraB
MVSVMDFGENVIILKDEDKGRTYYLVGTAHVSEESIKDVETVIEKVKPDTVCVELCEARYQALVDNTRWKNLNIFNVIREGKTLFLLANLAIGAYQRRLGAQLGIKPGAELLAGVHKAEEVGAELALIDRDIHATLKRTWANLGFFRKLQLVGGVFESLFHRDNSLDAAEIERLKESANLSAMLKEFSEALPEVKVPLIDERDQYLMSSIESTEGATVVAVVGAAHVPGMQDWFNRPVDRNALSKIPKPSMAWKLVKYIIPLALLVSFYFGYQKNAGHGLEAMLTAWILPNSIFCGLMILLAGGKLLTVLSGIIASPITSLTPLIGAGIVAGLIEAWLRKPTVEDCERINEDVQSFKGFYKNPFTRVLLVVFAATIGSSLGAWLGLGWVLTLLGS